MKQNVNLTNIAVPSLIANNLVIVHPMTSYSGSVAYLEYQSRTNKGDVKKGDMFNGVFALGEMNEARENFTSQVTIETMTADGSGVSGVTLTPMANKKFKDAEGNRCDVKVVRAGVAYYYDVVDGEIVDYVAEAGDKVAYFPEEFQMEHVPAQDIPTIGPVMKHIPLVATPRRIAVRYDQITAFQA